MSTSATATAKVKSKTTARDTAEEEYLHFLDAHVPHVMEKRRMRRVLCHVCCAECGTTSLQIHEKTCLKKHKW